MSSPLIKESEACLADIPDNLMGVLTDVDGTLTREGRLQASTYEALWSLHESGLTIIPVTGRSAAWAHMMLHHWPINAVIAESGGVALWRSHRLGSSAATKSKIHTKFFAEPGERESLVAFAEHCMAESAPLRWANDHCQRLIDVAIDWNEEVSAPLSVVERFVGVLRNKGYSAHVSNVHINAWAGTFDKASTCLHLLNLLYGQTPEEAKARWFFIGDAPNDESMFACFPHHVAVQGPEHFAGRVQHMPQRYAIAKASEGFDIWAQEIQRAMRSP